MSITVIALLSLLSALCVGEMKDALEMDYQGIPVAKPLFNQLAFGQNWL